MFRGTSYHRIDPKGRIVIPSRFRDLIGADGTAMITFFEGGLYAYTLEEWSKIEAKMVMLEKKGNQMRRFRRFFIGRASECQPDKQWRLLIPPELRQDAGLEEEIVLIGISDHFEIWSRAKWEEQKNLHEDDMNDEDFQNEIEKLGL
ncbi:division/cell wall cluster transcriptional repressor MraZ [Desulfosudis oleivorans]|uniref:Transcriptional regulator MraZ n=1 Tax=Desulfosudis oleivorans (strain DSM 6200 / JCM 39069 / Hxd3) TaxID=96561 RepID=MRAZ_DESOH|nr:division/cell wall cluster transcriptional repressor MraZ [Desulfosudis oleivorans]A8ZXX2.1 RecName: Full=Transcriptional regulator MraZ [Desulfosudis oleivorans Hxd3]ABW68599.1 MraZ protein [Desulfosudis oleivorans Hxd3]